MTLYGGGTAVQVSAPKPGSLKATTQKALSVKVPKGAKQHGQKKGKQPKLNKPKQPKPTNWLSPMTRKQVVNQANDTIMKAYGSSYQDLDQQQSRAQAINDKRVSDNKYYQDWLDSHMAALQSHADASNQTLVNALGQSRDESNALWNNQSQSLVDQANARAGNVSDNSQATPFGQQLTDNQDYARVLTGAGQTQALSNIGTGNDLLNATRANDSARVQATQSKQQSDYQTALGKIADARTKLSTARTGDIAKEIARLQGVEVQKAQYNQNFQATVGKLKLDAANIGSEIKTRNAQVGIAQQNANTAQQSANDRKLASDRTYQLDVQKYNSATAKDIYLRQHGLGSYRSGGSSSKSVNDNGASVRSPLGQASQNVIFNKIGQYQNMMRQLMSKHGWSVSQAWHSVARSSASIDVQLLNAATNLIRQNGLSPGDVRALHNRGVVIGSRLRIFNSSSLSGLGAIPNPTTIGTIHF